MNKENLLHIENLSVWIGERNLLKNVSLAVASGEIHILMGPNGSGKSSLAYAVLGHPEYPVHSGLIRFKGEDILHYSPEERAKKGLFLALQEPPEVGGVSMGTFLTTIRSTDAGADSDSGVRHALPKLGLEESFLRRFLNEGFSGGEKKKSEMLQLVVRRPQLAILDEIDSGVDVDSLDALVELIRECAGRGTGILLISHSSELCQRLKPDRTHILIDGTIAASGGNELAERVLREGYGNFSKSAV